MALWQLMVSGLESGANLKRIIRRSKFILAFSLLFRLVRLEFSPRSGRRRERKERKKEERERKKREKGERELVRL